MAKSASYSAYDQVASPSAGGTQQAGKDSMCQGDALGDPSGYKRATVSVAESRPDSKLQATRDKQLGTNIELTWVRGK